MTTVGFGDIGPRTTPERVYCIFVMFVGATAFGYIIGSVAASSGGVSGKGATDSRTMSMIYDFCDRHSLSSVVRHKLRRHVIFYSKHRTSLFDENAYMEELPVHLRIEVFLHVHRETLSGLGLFRTRINYKDWFLSRICSLLRPVVVVSGDFIYSKS